MGLFAFIRPEKPDPMAEVVRTAYKLGYAEGERGGAVMALEATASAIDKGLAGTDLPEDSPIRTLLLGIRRGSKATAAEIANG